MNYTKKIVLLSALLSTSSLASTTGTQQGSYVGIGLGFSEMSTKHSGVKPNYSDNKKSEENKTKEVERLVKAMLEGNKGAGVLLIDTEYPHSTKNHGGPSGMLIFGYNWVAGKVVFGVEANLGLMGGKSVVELPHSLTSFKGAVAVIKQKNHSGTQVILKQGSFMTLATRIGANVGGGFTPFFKIGVSATQLKMRMKNIKIDNFDHLSRKVFAKNGVNFRIVLGGGVDYSLTSNLMVGILGEVHLGSSKTYKTEGKNFGNDSVGIYTGKSPQFRSNSALFMVNLKYSFPQR